MDISPSDFNYTRIEPKEVGQRQVDITNITIHMPQCTEGYVQIQTDNFVTWLKPNDVTGEEDWVLVDGRGRRDSKRAQYNDFCMDGYFSRGDHFNVIGDQAEW